jgi:hypothetical protein
MRKRFGVYQYVCSLIVVLPCLTCQFSFGEDWTAAHTGLTDLDVRVLAIDPTTPTTLYAGGLGGVYKSVDGGAHWSPTGLLTYVEKFPPGLAGSPPPSLVLSGVVLHLAVDSDNPDVLYAGTNWRGGCFYSQRRVFKSTDAGASWTDRISPNINGCDNIKSLVLAPGDPNTLYLSNFDDVMGDTWSPIVKSTNGMVSWTYLGHPIVNVLAVDPIDSNTVYAGTFGFKPLYTSLPNGVLRSTDGGVSWTPTGLTNVGVTVLTIDPRNRHTIYAGTGSVSIHPAWDTVLPGAQGFRGLLKSNDGGATWIEINNGLRQFIGSRSSMTAFVVDPSNSNILYAGMSEGGVFRTEDGGETWTSFNDGLPNLNIRTLAIAPGSPNILYAATRTGVFKINSDIPTLSMDSTLCIGSAWKLTLTHSAPDSPIRLSGTSNGQPWEVQPWRQTDSNGNMTEEGIFTEGAQGTHTLRLEVGGFWSNTVEFAVRTCSP